MKPQTRVRTGIAVVTVLAADAVAHLYWMTGSTWPARDAGSLSRAVLNFVVPFTPRVLLVPLALLLAAATLVLIALDRPAWLSSPGTVIVSRLPRAVSRADGMERSRPSAPLPW
ncbi:hypothetical protein [Nonomuraea sp. CA-141351]|uniref:hypothetical protein n=1 Tax=Nonomuraea sp. CA-141351 TaxID=3239996 RepID=UPI003D900CE3